MKDADSAEKRRQELVSALAKEKEIADSVCMVTVVVTILS
jgi:hypothetical protein